MQRAHCTLSPQVYVWVYRACQASPEGRRAMMAERTAAQSHHVDVAAPLPPNPDIPHTGKGKEVWDEYLVASRESYATDRTIYASIARLAKLDPSLSVARSLTVIAISLITVGGTVGVVAIGLTSKDLAGIIVSGSVVLLGLLFAGFVNPLQTVERDIVFRRWSDMIVNAFAVELVSSRNPEAAADAANRRFKSLATSYGALASKATEALTAMAKESSAQTDEPEPTQLSIENPGTQTATEGQAIAEFIVAAKGPGTITYTDSGLPTDIKLDSATGKISGVAPHGEKDYSVTVTAASDTDGSGTAAVTFTISVKAKPEPPQADTAPPADTTSDAPATTAVA